MKLPLHSSFAYIHSASLQGRGLIPMTFIGEETSKGMRLFESISEETIRPNSSPYSIEGSHGWRIYKTANQNWWVRDQLCGLNNVTHMVWFCSAQRIAEQGASHFERTALKLAVHRLNNLITDHHVNEFFVCLLSERDEVDSTYALQAQAKVRSILTELLFPHPYQIKITLPGSSKSSLLRILDGYGKKQQEKHDNIRSNTLSYPQTFIDDWSYIPSGEVKGENGETWQLTQAIAMGQTPVTQALYEAVMQTRLPIQHGPIFPATAISWLEAVSFCNRLSQLIQLTPYYEINHEQRIVQVIDPNGKGIRLPKKHEWCYAACANRSWPYAGSNEPNEVAWSAHNSGSKVHPVARLWHNDFGLYDLSGNIWEWCEEGPRDQEQKEICSGDHHPKWLLGGSWANHPWVFPIGEALAELPGYQDQFMGFRITRTLEKNHKECSWHIDDSLSVSTEEMKAT